MYYIYYSDTSRLRKIKVPDTVNVIGLEQLATLIVNAGLVKW